MRISWITNKAAPYRLPVWEALGVENDLEVVLLENNERFLLDRGNRGSDWAVPHKSGGFRFREVGTRRIQRGEAQYFFGSGRKILGPTKPEVVLLGGWESPAYFSALRRARSLSVPVVGFYESTLNSQRHTTGPIARVRALFFRRLDAVVVPGVAAADALRKMGVKEDRIHIGFNAVDGHAIARGANRARSILSKESAGHKFIFIGQLIERKNPLGLLDAFNDISNLGDTLTVVGEGELEPELRDRCRADISLTGSIPYSEVPSKLAAHHTLVMPSHSEVWGLVANEALAAGLHVVVSQESGVAPSILAMSGVFVTPTSRKQLGDALARSRAEWTGPCPSPEILRHGPEEFADTFAGAFRSAVAQRRPNESS